MNKYDNNGCYDRFAGEDFSVGDRMQHVLKKSSNELMSIDDFLLLLYDMENWKYANGACSYGKVDCVGVYRFIMYWYYSESAYLELGANGTTVEYLYDHGLYTDDEGDIIKQKNYYTSETTLVVGMGLFRYGKKWNKKKQKYEYTFLHVAIYIGNNLGCKNGVIEAVESGVVIRELEDSEAINGAFTHYGFFRGLRYE